MQPRFRDLSAGKKPLMSEVAIVNVEDLQSPNVIETFPEDDRDWVQTHLQRLQEVVLSKLEGQMALQHAELNQAEESREMLGVALYKTNIENNNLKKNRATKDREVQQYASRTSDAEAISKNLAEELKKESKRSKAIENNMQKLALDLEEMRKKAELMKDSNLVYAANLKVTSTTEERLRKDLKQMQDEIHLRNKAYESLATKFSALVTNDTQLQQALSTTTRTAQQREAELNLLADQLNQMRLGQSDLVKQWGSAMESMNKRDALLHGLSQQVQAAEGALAVGQVEKMRLLQDIKQQDLELVKQGTELQSARQIVADLQGKIEAELQHRRRLTSDMTELWKEKSFSQEACTAMSSQLNSAKMRIDALITQKEEALAVAKAAEEKAEDLARRYRRLERHSVVDYEIGSAAAPLTLRGRLAQEQLDNETLRLRLEKEHRQSFVQQSQAEEQSNLRKRMENELQLLEGKYNEICNEAYLIRQTVDRTEYLYNSAVLDGKQQALKLTSGLEAKEREIAHLKLEWKQEHLRATELSRLLSLSQIEVSRLESKQQTMSRKCQEDSQTITLIQAGNARLQQELQIQERRKEQTAGVHADMMRKIRQAEIDRAQAEKDLVAEREARIQAQFIWQSKEAELQAANHTLAMQARQLLQQRKNHMVDQRSDLVQQVQVDGKVQLLTEQVASFRDRVVRAEDEKKMLQSQLKEAEIERDKLRGTLDNVASHWGQHLAVHSGMTPHQKNRSHQAQQPGYVKKLLKDESEMSKLKLELLKMEGRLDVTIGECVRAQRAQQGLKKENYILKDNVEYWKHEYQQFKIKCRCALTLAAFMSERERQNAQASGVGPPSATPLSVTQLIEYEKQFLELSPPVQAVFDQFILHVRGLHKLIPHPPSQSRKLPMPVVSHSHNNGDSDHFPPPPSNTNSNDSYASSADERRVHFPPISTASVVSVE
jgi:chromosome segregation ATPase